MKFSHQNLTLFFFHLQSTEKAVRLPTVNFSSSTVALATRRKYSGSLTTSIGSTTDISYLSSLSGEVVVVVVVVVVISAH